MAGKLIRSTEKRTKPPKYVLSSGRIFGRTWSSWLLKPSRTLAWRQQLKNEISDIKLEF